MAARSIALDWLAHNELPSVSQMLYNTPPAPAWWLKYFYSVGSLAFSCAGILLTEALRRHFVPSAPPNIALLSLQFLLNSFASEIPLNLILHAISTPHGTQPSTARLAPPAVVLINYNLKAYGLTEIETCFENVTRTMQAMLEASDDSVTVHLCIVSTTTDTMLRSVEKTIADQKKRAFGDRFHYLYRTSSHLRKCGNYHDLISFCGGATDAVYFDRNASTTDIDVLPELNIRYTLILDSDNTIDGASIKKLVQIAEDEPEYGIFQPNVVITGEKTFYQHVYATMTNLHANLSFGVFQKFKHSPFYGKGLLRNSVYYDDVIEPAAIPVFALSHDTVESTSLPTRFVVNASITETSPRSFVDWSLREERWNAGDIAAFAAALPACRNLKIANIFQRLFFATAAVRVLVCRPILLAFLLAGCYQNNSNDFMIFSMFFAWTMTFACTTIAYFLANSFLKLYTFRRVAASILCSTFFYAAEPIIGTLRLVKSIKRLCVLFCGVGNAWIPSGLVEERNYEIGYLKAALNEFWLSSVIGICLLYNFRASNFVWLFALPPLALPVLTFLTAKTQYPSIVCKELTSDEMRV